MNTELAAQRDSDGRWQWVMNNRNNPVGYCRGWTEWTQEMADRIHWPLDDILRRQQEEDVPFRHKFHTDGHATKEEAERCYYDFCLDHVREGTMLDEQRRCQFPGCEAWTQKYLDNPQLGMVFHFVCLCDEHRNREGLEAAQPFEPGTESYHS